ncbi:PTS system, mannose-specific IIC component [Pilibacter termitis]|uniref:PTS system, mannose-specific IIC component n=1 Tax=Pilibacter termitis TaxID=263852 RepID=A0A1T4MD57_9ENTE|nr:PTS mannose/fructose/sorbose transporter subunit IIC [Pilibacter termitis]SJZ64821.1 PTS system, mannose-specific IIC component [Pilibacter termitis]
MSIISMVLIVVVAFLAGMEGILDEFQFHQPLVACTLIGLVSGHLEAGIVLGGALQMIALGWANIGAAVAPDAALASVAAAIILVMDKNIEGKSIGELVTYAQGTILPVAVTLAVAGLFLTMIVRTLAVPIVHGMDAAAKEGNFRKIEVLQVVAICMQGVRIAIPAALILAVGQENVTNLLGMMPDWLSTGMAVGGGMVVAVGYAMVINMMATKEVWPFFAIGFVVAAITQITLIGLGVLGVALALIYLNLSKMGGSSNGGGASGGDPVGDIIDNY